MKDQKEHYYDNTCHNEFRILGIRMLTPSHHYTNILFLVKRMQKNFFQYNKWIFFYQGIETEKELIRLDNDFFDNGILYNSEKMSISVSAIVGENGSGKSTLVDMTIRILNNLGAAILGERPTENDSEHLHYISHVYAELMIFQHNEIKVISVYGGNINLKHYVPYSDNINLFRLDKIDTILQKSVSELKNYCLLPQPHLKPLLNELFYTCLFNYSSYAFNYLDYCEENTNEEKLKFMISKQIWEQLDDDSPERNWLTGLFHKNDGYQTPIVINPKRYGGIFDGVKENQLAKERLMSMLFYQDASGKFPFREINKNLHIIGLTLSYNNAHKWNYDYILTKLSINQGTNLYNNIKSIALDIIHFYKQNYDIRVDDKNALNYLIYKTLKIFRQYPMYRKAKSYLNRKNYSVVILWSHLKNLCKDESHITCKIRRTINYLTSDFYETAREGQIPFSELDKKIDNTLLALKKKFPHSTCSDLLPPPIFQSSFCITKSETSNEHPNLLSTIPFEGLSSGERQLTYLLSNFVYHLVNINSVSNRASLQVLSKELEVRYNYVNVIFDEIELYYHPDLQRRFVSYLIHALHNLTLTHLSGINIMLVTHSPFILSDIPSSNVLALHNSESTQIKETFCANIYEMLGSSFFMDYSIGQLAQEKVQSLFDQPKQQAQLIHHPETVQLARYLASHIGDEYIRRKVIEKKDELYKGDKYKEITNRLEAIDAEKRKLEEQLKSLK